MIPKVYKRVPGGDFSMQPSRVVRTHHLNNVSIEDEGVIVNQGIYNHLLPPVGTIQAENDLKNSDGSFKSILWHSLKHQYYSGYYTKEHPFDKTFRYLSEYMTVIGVPYRLSGEMLKPGTIKITNTNYEYDIVDDGKGNLYKTNSSILTRDFYNSNKLTCEIDFSRLYPLVRGYKANSVSRDKLNGMYSNQIHFNSNPSKEIYFNDIEIVRDDYHNGDFNGFIMGDGKYCRLKHSPDLNFVDGGFLIHFKFDVTGLADSTNADFDIINVNKVKTIQKKGLKIQSDNVSERNVEIVYEEDYTVPINIYPFRVTYFENKVRFRRSDGINTIQIDSDVISTPGTYDVQIYRYTDNDIIKISMYINGEEVGTVTDTTKYCFNDYDLLIGEYSTNIGDTTAATFEMVVGDVKFYNNIRYNNQDDVDEIALELSKTQNHYGGYIGNVFYRNGNIVLTPRLTSDFQYIDNFEYVDFKSVYTIYEYECLCRIGKGEFNITHNPTVRIHHESDIFIEEIQNGTMQPYFTSVGLYNDKGELMVVGKTAQPIQVRDDVDINLLINWSA